MRARFSRVVVVAPVLVVGALVAFAVKAGAQTAANAGGSVSAGATVNAGTGATVNGQVGFSRQGQLSPQEELAQSDAILGRLQNGSSTVSKQLGEARNSRDVVKVLCLNDKLSQMDVALRSAQDRKASLTTAAQSNNTELANHEFTILTVLKNRADQLQAEANQCIGEEAAFVGATQTRTTIDPDIPVVDQTPYPPTDPIFVSGPPLPTSAEK
jgi:hypothetical protein